MSFARLLLAPTLAAGAYASLTPRLATSRRLACEGPAAPTAPSPMATSTRTAGTRPILDAHQFATGSIIGIVSGMLLKRLGRLFFVVAGGAYLVLRALGASQLIPELPWRQAKQCLLNRTTRRDPDAPVTSSPILSALTQDLTFTGSFLATFLIGLLNT
ncbi:hypothetical protein BCR37DRAFT_162859 [Protomyces lactucae-debilis]|uniref:FUN14 family-domain-containing protein n=1 Tax=Protomyces lactucae-debilis TaxID=2754530 RepID=A0A1Y2EYM6_PROLT|nr:uncharacterized protein BCR37DRAFT_162859 [Protomyces lactucae-debilis]ORY76693.1 hypothetical protein BCR37DRAFT_162859 [Protomyces lactucae-debilis]